MDGQVFLGVMSGTSLDGLDLAACRFDDNSYTVLAAETIAFPASLKESLKRTPGLHAPALNQLDFEFGQFIGAQCLAFLKKHQLFESTTAIASHGHTVVHQPRDGFTLQIGQGATIAAASGLPAIVDFRSNDVAHGGQGAPLVPIGDLHLFSQYTFCLNLGGIANISCQHNSTTISGRDICGCNLLLNEIAGQMDLEYDDKGMMAATGTPNEQLLTELISYHITPYANCSLDAHEARHDYFNIARQYKLSHEDQLATAATFIARLTGATVDAFLEGTDTPAAAHKMLVTGGGAHNDFLVQQLKKSTPAQVVVPDDTLIDFKEAIVFAYLGQLRWKGQVNCLASVTGATKDTIGGVCYLP